LAIKAKRKECGTGGERRGQATGKIAGSSNRGCSGTAFVLPCKKAARVKGVGEGGRERKTQRR